MARRWSYALAFMTAVALATTACGGSGKQSATPDFTRQAEPSTSVTATSAPATATAAATPSPPVPGPEEYEGTDVRVLRVGGPGDIGSDTVVYYHVLCYACGPGGTNLYRAYRDPITRELRIDDLLSLDGRYDGKFRHALAADYQAGHMVVGVCTRGYCGGEGAASDDAEAIALRSRDGGVTWTEIGPLPPNTSFTGISEGEAVAVTHTNSPGEGDRYRYWLYPSGRDIRPPNAAAFYYPLVADGIGLTWLKSETGEFFAPDGTLLSGPVQGHRSWLVARTAGGFQFLTWGGEAAGAYRYLGAFDPAGRLPRAWAWNGTDLRVEQVTTAGLAFGNALLPEPWCGRSPGCEGQAFARQFPFEAVIIDLNQGTVHPMMELSRALTGNSHSFLAAVVLGRFAQVKTPGDCLNVRETPSAAGRVLGCYADGVLLGTDGGTAEGQGRPFVHVTTPDGREGWAADEFLAW